MNEKKQITNIFACFIIFTIMAFSVIAVQSNTSLETRNNIIIQKEEIKSGDYTSTENSILRVKTSAHNMNELSVNGVDAKTNLNITAETDILGKTKFRVNLRNGQEREIKIMPNVASERALEALKIHYCTKENNCEIQLKTVGSGEDEKLKYEMSLEKNSRIFGIFPTKMNVKVDVNASSGETEVRRPWWSFMAVESS